MADLYFFMRKTEFAVKGGIIKNPLLINCHVFFLKKTSATHHETGIWFWC